MSHGRRIRRVESSTDDAIMILEECLLNARVRGSVGVCGVWGLFCVFRCLLEEVFAGMI